MDQHQRYSNIFRLDGTNQLQRIPLALNNGYIQPDERSLRDLIRYGKRLAEEIRYYNPSGQAVGDWRPFFSSLEDENSGEILAAQKLQQLLDNKRDWPPHVALFIVFLKLYQILQEDINELPIRHLRHYYENELGLKRRKAQRDAVHVIFELAKNAAPTLLKTGTELDGGKDALGNPLIYTTTSDIVVVASQIKLTYRLIRDRDKRGNPRFFISDAIADSEGDSWHTFGRTQMDMDSSEQFMREAELGFALASPVFLLREGRREIHITLYLKNPTGEFPPEHHLSFALNAEITGEEGWLTPDYFCARLVNNGVDQPTLNITLIAEESAAPIVVADTELHTDTPQSPWPVVRFVLKGESGHYEVLAGLQVELAEITVDVTGVKDLIVQNEQSQLQGDKPMALFGSQPHVGSVFYVGSAEVFGKRLTAFTLEAQWQDKPDDLFEHYREYFGFVNYTLETEFAGSFTVDLDMLYQRTWVPLLNAHRLFDYSDPDKKSFTVELSDQSFVDAVFGENNYCAQPQQLDVAPFGTGSKKGFVRLVLTGPAYGSPYASDVPFEAFGHKTFAPRYAQQAIELSRDTSAEVVLPNGPYTPTLAGLTINYTAVSEFVPRDRQADNSFFTLDAFGYIEADDEIAARLVPDIQGEASLFIGIENSPIPANVSLLFQLDKGTATADGEALAVGETRWSYLADKTWEPISNPNVLIDSTQGFQKAGLVALAIGAEASIEHERMPAKLLWLQATIDKPADSACRLFAISDRAVKAQLQVQDEDLQLYEKHLQSTLPAETISKLKKRNAAIKKVSQPYVSFGGRGSEEDMLYFQSSSERLRHRRRAVTLWDMERLILNEFPTVFKVKCLPHSDAEGNEKAGELTLVIIPNLRTVTTNNPLEPRADAVLMTDIENFVSDLTTPYANIHVIHPIYERILVDAQVAFVSGFDAGYYTSVLNEELRRFLSPWAYEEGQDIVFGSRIYRSEILAFIEGREYVDYITDFKLYHSYPGQRRYGIGNMAVEVDFIIQPKPTPFINTMEIENTFVVGRGVEVARTVQGHAILVSHPEHRIRPVESGSHECKGASQLGIGYMTVELDFMVTP